jgi:hypothetical protein
MRLLQHFALLQQSCAIYVNQLQTHKGPLKHCSSSALQGQMHSIHAWPNTALYST